VNSVILFRDSLAEENECEIAAKYFNVIKYRSVIPPNSIVIGRYSVLPFYNDLCYDLFQRNCNLINSFSQHLWIANFSYYDVVKEHTFETWTDHNFHNCDYQGPFVVKGVTNSKKMNWNSLMFAKSKREASIIACELKNDGLICSQDIIYRKYVKLKSIGVGINGLPFSNEWRFFYYKDKMIAHGFYWSLADDKSQINDNGAIEFANTIAKIVSNYANFFVLDIAEKEKGGWILVEINDGQMAGLSDIDIETFYKNLKNIVNEEKN